MSRSSPSSSVFTRRSTSILIGTTNSRATSDDISETHSTVPVPETRGAWTMLAARPAAPDGDLMPYASENIVQEVVEDGEDPGCDVYDCEDDLVGDREAGVSRDG